MQHPVFYSFFVFLMFACAIPSSISQIQELEDWLSVPVENREALENLPFAQKPVSQLESDTIVQLLLDDLAEQTLTKFGQQWDDRKLIYDQYEMPFYYQTFGSEPEDGRSLYISLHGGGGTTAEINDQQYQNQKHLYDNAMSSLEGIYLAPRAPTNTWNMWHQGHIDVLLNLMIQLAVLKENVNPNKIYLLGYSAGGDGVYQLAQRMADCWAAAAMMAGHPNDASPLGLRNTPFTIHVGALDNAFNRNGVAEVWGQLLDSLNNLDPGGYLHDVQLHEVLGHWMNLEDAVALPWMAQFVRNPIPQRLVWKQSSIHHTQFYWMHTPKNRIETGGELVAEYDTESNAINLIQNYADTISIFINDDMLDLDTQVTIQYQGVEIFRGMVHRSILNMYSTLSKREDRYAVFPSVISILNNELVLEENINVSVEISPLEDSHFVKSVYPTVSHGQIQVEFQDGYKGEAKVIILDMQGKIITQSMTNQKLNQMYVGDFVPGMYLLKIKQNQKEALYKILKK